MRKTQPADPSPLSLKAMANQRNIETINSSRVYVCRALTRKHSMAYFFNQELIP